MDDFSRVLVGIENWFDEANRVSEEINEIQLSIEDYCFYVREGVLTQDEQENSQYKITSSISAVGSQIERLKQTREQSLGVLHFKSFAKIGFFIQGHKKWKYAIDVLEETHRATKEKWPKVVSYFNKKLGIAESSELAPSWAPDDFEIAFFADNIGNGFSIPLGCWFGVGRDAYSNVNERLLSELNQVIVELNAGGVTLTRNTPNPQNSLGNESPKGRKKSEKTREQIKREKSFLDLLSEYEKWKSKQAKRSGPCDWLNDKAKWSSKSRTFFKKRCGERDGTDAEILKDSIRFAQKLRREQSSGD